MEQTDKTLDSFRLPVDLTCLFDDERSWCYIYLEPEKFSAISDVESYLQNLFKIPPPIRLFIGKYLLPSPESVKLLCTGDTLRVVGGIEERESTENSTVRIKKRKHSHAKKNSSNLQENFVSDVSSVVVTSEVAGIEGTKLSDGTANVCDQMVDNDSDAVLQCREKQPTVLGLTELIEVKQFKQKNKRSTNVSENIDTAENGNEHQEFVESGDRHDKMLKESNVSVMSGNQQKIFTEPAPSDCDVDLNIDTGASSKKRKRTRHRRRKMMLSSSVGEAVSLIRSSILPLDNIEKHNTSVSGYCTDSSSKHIRFSDDDGNTSFTAGSDRDASDVKEKFPKVFCNGSMQSPRVRSASGWDVRSSPHSMPQTQNFVNLLSLRNKAVPVVFERKPTKQEASEPSNSVVGVQVSERSSASEQTSNNRTCESSKESMQQEHCVDPSNYPVLSLPPKKCDVILFKTLVLTESCIPQLSSYIMATVVDFCPLSQDVTLQITSNGQELHQQPLKFAAVTQTDLPKDDFTILNWNEIHETRLVTKAT